MMTTPSYAAYMAGLDDRLRQYIPPRSEWSPADEVVYGQPDLYATPPAEAERLQYRAIRHAFERHYRGNTTYRNFCLEQGFSPDDLRSPADLDRIPLLPDRFFKDYPEGRAFATWLGNIFTGELPKITIRGLAPTFEETVSAFNAAGLVISYSSGTGGRHTVIPRDARTYNTSQYAAAKAAIGMAYPNWTPDASGYLLMPNPRKTNVYAGKVCGVYFDAIADVRVAIDRNVRAEVVRMAMTGSGNLKAVVLRTLLRLSTARMINKIIQWLRYHRDHTKVKLTLVGAPFILASVMDRLEQEGESFDFSGRAGIATGGGWKIYEDRRVTSADFRARARKVLGIEERLCLDVYGMVEGNGWMIHCPEGHYFHIPTPYFRPLVLGPDYKPLPAGQWGRFAFLDAAAYSYPGFVISGDVVRLLEHCPVCDRPGPVLEPEIRRAVGEEMRGCGEEVRRMVSANAGEDR